MLHFLKLVTPLNAVNGFRNTVIFNCDMDVSSEVDFLPVSNVEDAMSNPDNDDNYESNEGKNQSVSENINIQKINETTPDKQPGSKQISS